MAQMIELIRFPALTSLGSRKAETAPEGAVSAAVCRKSGCGHFFEKRKEIPLLRKRAFFTISQG